MVCSVGSVKMAVMAQLLASGSFSQAVPEKAGHQKLVTQYIQKELLEADEANLLDEEDMHIFDLNPLTDPLHLVCCNSCKKPVKSSQFVGHTELCRSFGFEKELVSELGSGAWSKKPKKERKKLVSTGNQVTSTGAQERFATVDPSETAFPSSQLDERVEMIVKTKGAPQKITGLVSEIIPPSKRPKLVAADCVQPSDDIEKGVSKFMHSQDASIYVPAPLATKKYYSQSNNRLQATICRMYHQPSVQEWCSDKRAQGNLITSEASSPEFFSNEQIDSHFDKKHVNSSPSTQNTQAFVPFSEVSFIKDGCESSTDHLNQFPLTDASTSQIAAFGAMKTRYHSRPYSYPSNPG